MYSPTAFSTLPRRTVSLVLLLIALLMLCGARLASTAQSPTEERVLENTVPARLPIKVKIKNWEKVKDLKNDDWYGEMEVEVTNTGEKPIYLLVLSLLMPEVSGNTPGSIIGAQLRYGRTGFGNLAEKIEWDDVPIRPRESIILKVPENIVKGWKLYKTEKNISNPKKIRLKLLFVNFGDGTGLSGPEGSLIPHRSKRDTNIPCREETGKATGSNAPPDSSPRLFDKLPFFSQPVGFSAAKAEFS
ncbi:MAG TPA: hypothetical protein VGB73_18590 [Pyrinomonadaceae bacterium]|jgi:hypothetical protein